MPDPLTLISAGSALAGLVGSLFGSGRKEIPIDPRILEVFNMLKGTASEGISDQAENDLINQARTNISNEAGGLAANQRRRIALQGGGVGSQNVAANRLNTARLGAIGQATTQASLADEQAKKEAQRLLAGFAPALQPQSFQTGQGFSDLFGAGVNFLINRPGGRNNQSTATRNENFFDRVDPFFDPTGQPLIG